MDTTKNRRLSALRAVVAVALMVPAMGACELSMTEGICMDDEVWIQYTQAGGGDCRPQSDGDPDCPDGDIPREQRPGREMDCVPNDITKEPYADK